MRGRPTGSVPEHAVSAGRAAGTAGTSGGMGEVLLGRYRVLARRGAGGFGAVCTCWDTRLQRRVAIKRMPLAGAVATDGTVASTMGEALREARTASLLAHPNIVSVFDFETDGSYAYLVMEYVDGLNLAELLARVEGGTLTHDETSHLLQSLSSALAYAHENGVLHLDIKPTNILVDRAGHVKLADFGMATLASAAGYGDARGGTVGYMPPEQLEGGLVDERSDVFSLGVVLWQALTGKDPFASETAKGSLALIAHGPKPGLAKLDPDLDPVAAAALEDALAGDPRKRTPSVRQLAGTMVPLLGDPAAGAASLAGLVSQSDDDAPDATDAPWAARHLPFLTRFPWAETAFERTLAAVCALGVALEAAPFAGPLSGQVPLVALAAAASAAAWPPAGSLVAGGVVVWALATADGSALSAPLAVLVALGLAVWWAAAGRRDHLATPAVLLGCLLPGPWAGAFVAAFAQSPLPALLTGLAGCALGMLCRDARALSFAAAALVPAAEASVARPGTWVVLAGAAVSALAGAALTCRGSVRAQVAGQIACAGLLLLATCAASMVENAGIWALPDTGDLALALGLCLIGCIACALRGPLEWGEEA